MKLKHILILPLLALAVFSCTKEEVEVPVAPESYDALLKVYESGQTYIDVTQSTGATTFTWEDETKLTVSDINIENCIVNAPKVLATDNKGFWMLAGQVSKIKKDESLSDRNAYPIYVYFNKVGLYLCLTNGNRLLIKKGEQKVKSLPVLTITSAAPITSKDYYVTGTIKISNPDHMYSTQDGFSATMQIKGRGNSTWGMPKKPYKIKLDSKSPMLGMNTEKDWVLLAEYADKTLLRNTTAMELSRICGFSWTPEMRHVEVNLNGQYQGVYTLAEHKEVSSKRVNINPDAGDMYFEIEQNQDEAVCWWTEHSAPMMLLEPENPSDEIVASAKKLFKDFETALWDKDFSTVYDMIDVRSFVNYYIVQEITKNIDGNIRKSTFLTKTVKGKLEMYHVWDFDLTLGNCDYYDDGNNGPTGWWIKDRGYAGKNHGWYYRLFMDPNFVKMVQDRWDELLPEFKKVPDFIDEQKRSMSDAPTRNFQKWNILNTYVWPNYKVLGNYDSEVEWLKTFYNQRIEWLDKNINAL